MAHAWICGVSGGDLGAAGHERRPIADAQCPDICPRDRSGQHRGWPFASARADWDDGSSYEAFRKSEDSLTQFVNIRGNTKPHLAELAVRD
jgi:hypothetical protein